MAQNPKKTQQPTPAPRMTRRALSRHQREQRRQRLVMLITAGAVGLALIAILGGVLYDRVWIPSRPVATVGSATLSRGDYWTERRNDLTRRVAQSIQLLAMFGGQFGNQFEGQIPQVDSQIATVRTSSVDDDTVASWIQRQVIIQGAAKDYSIQASDGEVAQRLVADLGGVFPAPAPVPTDTTTLTPTAELSATNVSTPTSEAGATSEAATTAPTGEAATAGATEAATSGPTNAPEPTKPPTPTLGVDAATTEADAVLGRLYDDYQQQMLRLAPTQTANVTLDDFRNAMHDQYLQQVVTTKVQEQLVPEASFTPSTEPTGYEVSQILISVTSTVSETQAQQDAAFAEARPRAEAILQELRGGADFAAVAKEKSDDYATRNEGGRLTKFDKNGKTSSSTQMDPAIVQATLALKQGDISDLIRTPFGWHIIKLDTIDVPTKAEQLQDERTKKFDEWVTQKRAELAIERFPAVTPTPTLAPTTESDALPTQQLASTPTPTAVVTATTTLSGTATLPTDLTPTATSATQVPTGTPLPTTAAPSAVLPETTGTAQP